MYKVDKKLGQGSFGVVYHLQISDGSEFAVKVSQAGRLNDHQTDSANEAELMLKLSHVHLVQCCAAFSHGRHVYLVMELCSHGTLKQFLSTRTKFVQEAQVLSWLGQMADALRYLHICRVIHRDLKTENVFLDDRRNLKIGDLGISREMDYTAQRADTFTGTFCYMSPEVLQDTSYSFETDIWSLGCCVHEVMTLQQTFSGRSMMEVMQKIMEANIPEMPDIYSESLKNLVTRMLDRKARRRPDGLEILYFVSQIQGFPFESVPYQPLQNVEINPKLLCEAVQNFEEKYLGTEVATLHTTKWTATSAIVEETENADTIEYTDSDVPSSDLLNQHQKTRKLQPRPLPRRFINKDTPISPEDELPTRNTINEELLNFPISKELTEQNNETEECTTPVKPYYTLTPQDSPPPHPSSSREHRDVSNNPNLTEDQPSNINTRTSQEWRLLTAEPVPLSNAGDADVNISKYMDILAAESKKWLRLKFGLPEENRRHLEGHVINNEADSDNGVTLYTRAQIVKYNARQGKLEKADHLS